MKLKQEEVDTGILRAAITGGWLVHISEQIYNNQIERWEWELKGGYFVPDPEHKWDIKEEKEVK